MTQQPYTFKHSPQGLIMVRRETDVPKGRGNSYQQSPQNQQANRQRAHDPRHQQPVQNTRMRTRQPTSYDEEEEEIDDVWPVPLPKSARRYPQPGQYDQGDTRVNVRHAPPRVKQQSAIPPRRSRQAYEEEEAEEDQDFEELETERPPRRQRHVSVHPLLIVGIALVLLFSALFAGYVGLNAIGAWWQNHQDDVTYGMPRTYQIDAVVGHNDSNSNPSHFIAINLRGSIYIIEAPGGNISKSRSYFITSEVGGNPYPPVTIKFQDLTHSGRLDMVVTIGDPPTPLIVFLFNNGSQFLAKSQ